MRLSPRDWTRVELREAENKASTSVRILHLVGGCIEKTAVLELNAPFGDARTLPIRQQPVAPDVQVVSLAYPRGRLRFGGGRFVRYGAEGEFA